MLHHSRSFVRTLKEERRATAARQRPPADAEELERVVLSAAAGDPAAFSRLVERFSQRVRAVARRHRLAVHDVEDVMQTTWMRLQQHADKIRDPNALGAWLETTARRESLRITRSTGRERPTDDPLLVDAAAPSADDELVAQEDAVAAAARRAALTAAIERLPANQRELLAMLIADPTPSYAEISRELGMPIGGIGPTRARALARLRESGYFEALAERSDEHRLAGVVAAER